MNTSRLVLAVSALSIAIGFGAGRLLADDAPNPPAQAPAAAADAKAAKVRKLLALQGGEALAKMTLDKMLAQFQAMPGLPHGFAEKFAEKADVKQIMELGLPAYVKHVDEATLDAAIAFYESPHGRKLSESLPAVTMEAMDAGAEWGRKLGAEVARELLEEKRAPK